MSNQERPGERPGRGGPAAYAADRDTGKASPLPPADSAALPRVGVLAVLWHQGRVLLVQRGQPPNQGLWGFPGGKQHPGETVAEAAMRELTEETGLGAAALGVIDVLDAMERDADGVLLYHYTLIAIACRWQAGEAKAADDAAALGWFRPEEAATLPRCKDVDTLITRSARHPLLATDAQTGPATKTPTKVP